MKRTVLQKWLSSFLTFVLVFGSFGTNALAAVLTLPSELQIIEEEAFYGTTSLDEVIVPEGATEIRSKAFADSSLNNIELPESISYIADDAFDGVDGLSVSASEGSYAAEWWNERQDGPMPSPMEDFEYVLKADGTYMITGYVGDGGDIVVPAEIQSIPITSISDYAFFNCSTINSVSLPKSITSIGEAAFYGCTGLVNIYFPEKLSTIGEAAFANCSSLVNLDFPSELTSIANFAFQGCTAIENIIFSDSVDFIGEYSFSAVESDNQTNIYCKAGSISATTITGNYFLSSFVDPAYPTLRLCQYNDGYIALGIAAYLDEKDSIVIPAEVGGYPVIEISSYAFYGNDVLKNIVLPDSVIRIQSYAFCDCNSLTSINLPDNILSIDDYAFYRSGLESIFIPQNVSYIGECVFRGCSNLTAIDVADENRHFLADFGILFSNDYEHLICCPENIDISNYSIPYGVKTIEDFAFGNCASLSTIHIPGSVKSIGDYAFYESSLSKIFIEYGLTSIGQHAFTSCKSLMSIELPDSVTDIGGWAFAFSGLNYCKMSKNVKVYPEYLFSGCTLTSCYEIQEGVTTLSSGALNVSYHLRVVTIPPSVSYIADDSFNPYAYTATTIYGVSGSYAQAFAEEKGFHFVPCEIPNPLWDMKYTLDSNGCLIEDYLGNNQKIALPDSILGSPIYRIDDYAFNYWNGTQIALPNSLKTIGAWAFSEANSLETIIIPESVETIGNSAFRGCNNLKKIFLPNNPITIENYAFYHCDSLLSITIPSEIKSLGQRAFSTCGCLESVYIEEGLTTIDFGLFEYCGNLKHIAIPPSVNTIEFGSFDGCYELTIYGEAGSYAETYARNNNIPFSTDPFPGTESEPEVDPIPQVIGFVIENNTITTGDAACFTIETANAYYVQLIVDGQYYDSMPVTTDVTVMGRMFTLAGERQVAFRAYGNGRWSEPCEVQTLTVTAAGMLDEPIYECSAKIWLGDTLTVKWSSVENADGYVLYLNYPDGTSQAEGIKLDASTTTYTYKSASFPVTGNYSVRIMAYGAGYSQSSALAPFAVTDEYITWQGWPQSSKVNTYETADSSTPNGYVDYLDPVTVLGEDDDCYFIEMFLTAGGSAQRYVRKSDIGTEPYTPGLTLSVSYARGTNDELYLYANTNLVGCKAGVELNGESLGILYSPTAVKLYTNVYAFKATPIIGTTTYRLWAEDASGTRLVKELSVTIKENTPAPEITPTPTPTPKPEITTSPEITVDPEETSSPIVSPAPEEIIIPNETASPELEGSCKYATASGHQLEYVLLQDMSLLLYDNGQIRVNSAVCPGCGGTISDFGFVPDNVQTQFYFHPIAHYYDTSGNGQVYCTNHDYKLILANEDLTITHSIDLNGAPLTVNGILRVEATLSNVGEIRCNELIIEKNGVLIAQDATSLHVGKASSAGKIDIKDGGKLFINPYATITAGNTTINGMLEGCDTLECTSLSVGSNGHLGLTNGFTANISKNFTFNSNTSHSASFGKNSILNISGDIRISGKQFSFDGTCYLKGKKQLLKMEKNDSNYFDVLDMSAGGSMLTINEDETELINNNWNSSNSFKAKTVKGSVIDSPAEAVVKNFFDFILIDPLQSGSGFAWLEGASDFVKPLLNEKMQIDEEEYRKLLFESVSPVEKEVDPSEIITGEIGLVTFDNLDDQEKVKQAIRYGLMTEMFIKQGTHDFDFSGFSLNFSAIKGDSLWYTYKDKKYTMELNGISMKTTSHGVSREIYFIEGTIKESNGKKNSFSYTTNLDELKDAALLLQAAGTAEAIAELESTLDIIVDSGKEALKLLDMFDELDYKAKLKQFVYEQCPIKVQEVADWIEWIDDQFSDDEKQLFKDFKKYYELSLKFYPPQP